MSPLSCFSEPFTQTTRVTPGGFVLSADASERAFGTLPPAAGLTEVSGLGSGQYAVRSTCASATAAHAISAVAASIAAQTVRRIMPRSLKTAPFRYPLVPRV